MFQSLAGLFRPRSVAVIGASTDQRKPGGRALHYLRQHFEGEVLAVNPRAPGMLASIEAATTPPDVALIAVPANAVAAELARCASAGVRSAIVLSSGFAEVGESGQALQDAVARQARQAGMRVLGPNCIGLFGVARGYYATFTAVIGQGLPQPGPVAMVSQSGAVGAHVFSLARDSGIGFSYWAATGNQMDVDVADCIGFYAQDPDTRVIVACMEGCPDGDKLQRALAAARVAGKPVIALKLGRTAVGASAAATHTGSLVGSDAAFDAVFERHGVQRVHSFEEMVDLTAACAQGVYPRGNRLGIASISGGAGIMMADDATDAGLELPALPDAAQARLRALAPLGATRNPVDTTATAMVEPYLLQAFLGELLADVNIDSAVLFLSNVGRATELIEPLRRGLAQVRRVYPHKPVALVVGAPEAVRAALRDDGFLIYEDPLRAVRALAGLARIAQVRRRDTSAGEVARDFPALAGLRLNDERGALLALQACGLPVAQTLLATSAQSAIEAARRLGYPVVLKIASPDIAHKCDVGGVALGLANDEAVESAFERVMAAVRRACPDARLEGVLVAPMVTGGVELIFGGRQDAVFGPMVMAGMGGVFVETYHDIVLRVAPVDEREAREMIMRLKGAPLLTGARGRPVIDLAAAASALSRVSHLIAAARNVIAEIDVNPFIALPQGGVAVDALIVPIDSAGA